MKKLITAFAFSALLILTSCESSEKVYNVGSEFEPYVQNFLNEAKKYGYNFDEEGIVVRFGKVNDGVAAWCYVNRIPIQIEVDKAYWNKLTGPNEHNLKEDIIFHEMAHGFLKRMHTNEVFENNEWKSLMSGGELPNNREPVVNYRGMRKAYYIEELFSEGKELPTPTWVTEKTPLVQPEKTLVSYTPSQLPIRSKEETQNECESKLVDGRYEITNFTSNPIFIPVVNAINIQNDFYYEIQLQSSPQDTINSYCGLAFGQINVQNDLSYHYITTNCANIYNIGESSCVIPFVNNYYNSFKKEETYKLGVLKKGNMMYYYKNDEFIYYNDIDNIPLKGNTFGYILAKNTTLYIDNITLKVNSLLKTTESISIPDVTYIKVEETVPLTLQ